MKFQGFTRKLSEFAWAQQVKKILYHHGSRPNAHDTLFFPSREQPAHGTHRSYRHDVAIRKQLARGGLKAIDASNDPMLAVAKLIDPPARRVRQMFEQQVDEPQRQAYGKIANARFAVYGSGVYSDATFTLRLAFGEAKGYLEDGQKIPWAYHPRRHV
jgi:hypothetical protein